jgi:hypothetical protein
MTLNDLLAKQAIDPARATYKQMESFAKCNTSGQMN